MVEEGTKEGTTSTPMRHDAIVWVDKVMVQMMAAQWIINNAWLKMEFVWFDKEEGERVFGVLRGAEGII